MKSTSGVVNGERRAIYKDPKTDDGVKKSARGLLRVEVEDGEYVLYDQQTEEQEKSGVLQMVFEDGTLWKHTTLSMIRHRLM
jgi:nicotinamide phosphoribosyltransferase